MKRLKISRKKTFFHPEADEEERRIFKKKISVCELMRIPLIHIDESGFSEDMPRMSGHAPAGVRCFGKHDVMPKRLTDVVGALTGDKLLAAALFDGAVNTDVSEVWQGLLPVLPNGAAAAVDNAPLHKSERIQEAAEAVGRLVEHLPPYSPDLNPMEHKLAQAKALRKKFGFRPMRFFSNHACSQFIVLRLYLGNTSRLNISSANSKYSAS